MTNQNLHWSVIPNDKKTETVAHGGSHRYDLYNTRCSEAVKYGKRRWGINLVWGDPATSNNLKFQRDGKASTSPLKYGEKVAIHVRKGKWLRYKRRKFGINLSWSTTPKYEWIFQGGPKGTPIKTGVALNLYNTVEKDYLIYDPRDWGINLKWSKDKGKFNDISKAIDLAEDVAPVALAIGSLIGGSGND